MSHSTSNVFSIKFSQLILLAVFLCYVSPKYLFAADKVAFDGMCAMGMSVGQPVETDCSITWKDENGKTYCFSNKDSKVQFLENPEFNLVKANDYFTMNDIQKLSKRMQRYRNKDVKQFLKKYIETISEGNSGLYPLYDPLTKKTESVVFKEIQMMRTLHGYGFFPDVIFHDKNEPDRKYWVDFWLKPKGEKDLELIETRIYKGPRKSGSEWQLMTRQPVPWWWIPASEHPGESEHKRGWEIMSAIEQYIIEQRDENGMIKLTVPDSGEQVSLEYIGLHQPVRRLKDNGRFFACTDFRKEGSENEYYDVDFWLDDVTGNIKVGDVRVHKIPEKIDGNWVQIPKYNFDDMEHEVVP